MVSIFSTVKQKITRAANGGGLQLALHRLAHYAKESFSCPVCHYHGPFADLSVGTGFRKHAKCPKCGALERHRLQYVVLRNLAERYDFSAMALLHIAPEAFFRKRFEEWFGSYTTADVAQPDVDYHADLTDLPFSSNSYDCLFASHVLEHIKDDGKALAEIRRVLNPGGIAILPVPLIADVTVEYPEPNPHESHHVRAPGFDYFERYREHFDGVEEFRSEDFPSEYQLYTYEDRTTWPTETMPLRPPTQGVKHVDVVPVCHVGSDTSK